MKKIIIIGIILVTLTFLTLLNNQEKTSEKLVVAEVTHSVFYAPWYVALTKNYFEDLEIEVILTSGANNVIASVISGDADIGLCGPEAIIYTKENELKDPILAFSSLTKRDGQFLVLRKNINYKEFNDLENLTILAGRSGGMPLLNFTNAIKNTNTKNVTIDSSIDFANLSSAFISGSGDGVNLFEPNATYLVKQGYGFIADNIGTYSGTLPYTTFNAKSSFINNNQETITKFYEGIKKGLEFVEKNDSLTIAETIKSEFPDTDIDDLTQMIQNYKNADVWYSTPTIPKQDLINLQDIMIDNKEIEDYISYEDLIYEIN